MSRVTLAILAAALVSGCATVLPQEAFREAQPDLEAAVEARVVWRTGSDEDRQADALIDSLLARPLGLEGAVQVALLSNRRLQATYEDLGVAQASLVQAGLLGNPAFGGRALWPLGQAGAADLGFTVAFGLLDAFRIPLRRAVSQSEYAAARARIGHSVLDLATRTRTAYLEAIAARDRLEVQRAVVANAEAGYQAALLLREAGNVPSVDLLAEQAQYEQARIDAVGLEAEVAERHEAMARTLGVFGDRAAFVLEGAMPAVPESLTLDAAVLEAQAVASSLGLEAARAEVEALGRQLGVVRNQSLLPDLEIGGEFEREEGEWQAGPEVEVVLPLFDQGQARRARVRAELRRRQATYYALGVETRSAARALAARLIAAHRIARQYQTVVLPLRADLTQATLRQYNAMQTGVFGLLQAQRLEADAALGAIDATLAFWTARTDLDALLLGRMPALEVGSSVEGERSTSMSSGADH